VPTYRSLMIHFDPHRMSTQSLIKALDGLDLASARPRTGRARWRIPACYDPPHGEDIAEIAASLGLPQERLAELHRGARYRVYMYGFAPGWTFLGGLPEVLAIPRRALPRSPVPPGSLLIAGGQALVAGCSMPTGWYAVGRTPVNVFDPGRERVFLAQIGDEICFDPIGSAEFNELSAAAEAGELVARQEFLNEA
jgi:inhibitor of KinA